LALPWEHIKILGKKASFGKLLIFNLQIAVMQNEAIIPPFTCPIKNILNNICLNVDKCYLCSPFLKPNGWKSFKTDINEHY
jgi:hypothetical protein